MISQRISLMIFVLLLSYHSRVTNGQSFSFSQPATGPISVCEGSDVTLQCVVVLINTTTVRDNSWSRNISGMVTTINTLNPIPNHKVVFNPTNGGNDLVITNVTQEDNNAEYICSDTRATITSSVVFNVTGIPPVENLMAVDNCTHSTVSWDITDEGTCKDLSYNVLLTSLDDGVILQSMMTNDTSHTFSVEGINELFSVSVSVFNVNTRGPSRTAIANVNAPNDIPSPIDLRNASRICVTYFNISWDASNRITCGDVSYEVFVSQPQIGQSMKQITRVGDTFYSSVTGLNNSDPDVMVTVTASNKAGQGNMSISVRLSLSQDPPPINDVIASTNRAPADLSRFDIFITWSRPVINDPCTTLPVSLYTINASVVFMNGTQTNYVSNNIMDTSGDSMGRFYVSYNDSFDEELVPNATYVFAVNSDAVQLPPSPTPSMRVTKSDDELSTGVAVAIIFGVTFIITLIVTALISVIITSLYYKYRYELKEKVKVDDDKNVNTRQDPYGGNITMDTNPAYGNTATIKMDTNPAYATTTT